MPTPGIVKTENDPPGLSKGCPGEIIAGELDHLENPLEIRSANRTSLSKIKYALPSSPL
jgi:hypothetical protein